ncbi:MAG: copper resistance protein CopC [Actinobacteria bacterium]|nr:copper resistance protein CopC [Actinomycetota bacterium]
MRKVKALLLAVGLVFSGTQGASAHAELIKSFPVANSTLTKAPKYVQLEFGEAIITLKSKNANSIVVLDSKAKKIETSKIAIKKAVARVEFMGTLKPGKYLVKYRIASADGHILTAQYKFSIS